MTNISVGIDPGVTTGYAVNTNGKLETVTSGSAVSIENLLSLLVRTWQGHKSIKVYIEDARMRSGFYGNNSDKKKQGAGSVKRDSQRWEEFCGYHGIDYELVHPKNNKTKLKAEAFQKLTGWEKRTNEHSRDAAMLVFGRR